MSYAISLRAWEELLYLKREETLLFCITYAHIISANLQARFSCVRYVHRKFRSRCYTVRKMRPGVLPLGRCCVKPIRRNPAQKPRLQSVTDGSLLMPVTPRQEYTEVKQVHERCASSTYCRVKVPPALEVSSSSSSDYFHRASSYCEPDQRVLSRCFPTPIAHGEKEASLRLTRQVSWCPFCHVLCLIHL